MDTKKPEGTLFETETTNRMAELARLIAEHQDLTEEEAFKRIRQHFYKIILELQQNGEADVLGIGKLKKEPGRGYRLHRYPEEVRKKREQLRLQQQFGGIYGNFGERALDKFNIQAEFSFPLESFISRLSVYTNTPVDELKQKFQEQLEKAYAELMEKGIGYLPDFGYIRCTGDELNNVEFGINEKVAAAFRKHQSEESDDE